jgi:hypothetical protein
VELESLFWPFYSEIIFVRSLQVNSSLDITNTVTASPCSDHRLLYSEAGKVQVRQVGAWHDRRGIAGRSQAGFGLDALDTKLIFPVESQQKAG